MIAVGQRLGGDLPVGYGRGADFSTEGVFDGSGEFGLAYSALVSPAEYLISHLSAIIIGQFRYEGKVVDEPLSYRVGGASVSPRLGAAGGGGLWRTVRGEGWWSSGGEGFRWLAGEGDLWRRLVSLVVLLALLLGVGVVSVGGGGVEAHNIPTRVTVYGFIRPEGERLRLLMRVPMEVFGEISFPVRGRGYLEVSEAGPALREAAAVYITDSVFFYEDGRELTDRRLEGVRVDLPSDRSFVDYGTALANIQSPLLRDDVELFWRQGVLDILVSYAIESEDSDFAVEPRLGLLADETTTVLRFILPDGEGDSDSTGTSSSTSSIDPSTDTSSISSTSASVRERAFTFTGNPGLVELDPRWHQAALRFVQMGFVHILEGTDHLLFLFCLVIPLRSLRRLIPVVTSFTIAHSITLIGSAFGVAPDALWFPPLIEALIALSIVYMAFENIFGAGLERRWLVTFGFGLVHGFGFSFLFSETLQFAGGHLLSSLLAFNIGVELGQLLILALVIPLLNGLFRLVDGRIGIILLSALVAHSAWHWMLERGGVLGAYSLQAPILDALFWAGVMRWGMLLIITGLVLWAMRAVFRRFSL